MLSVGVFVAVCPWAVQRDSGPAPSLSLSLSVGFVGLRLWCGVPLTACHNCYG